MRLRTLSRVKDMFLNKWTAQLNCPGQIVERAFDSQEEVLAFVRQAQTDPSDGTPARIIVIDPQGKQALVTSTGADRQARA
jgi:hypothetical protein